MEYVHMPVLAKEVKEYLIPPTEENPVMVDCTTGEGGHTHMMLNSYPNLTVYGLDCDEHIQEKAKYRMKNFGDRFIPVHTWFDDYFKDYSGPELDLVLIDLGISIYHYEESNRGFSFKKDEKLDMRLNEKSDLTAQMVVNSYSQEDLANLIYKYGEERYSRRIAKAICEARGLKKIESSNELETIIFNCVPQNYKHGRLHPATRTFQALRIEVNNELDRIESTIINATKALKVGGRMAVISFHSLEDRIVKWTFKELAKTCTCPPEAIYCTCDTKPLVKILTKKPIVATEEENKVNPPSRSAKLRVIERI
ncbi:MAG: 16S rRNA (cytosine(1402)-N(4))-methyltransferase RsmH [Sphaerochaetaceae bacterium]|nr:16S rRNA (cytosine(1402)-N(4))-methyltransferase RsmH [Sphaerochaetaceae bacterium]MDC7237049.1 16S rRNA (cytosine(1402)-N(4))-methyltransferase RsmH [Sphaerochaetaceae bacterium]